MSNKILWLKGCAGLGNRLYTLSAAIEYAKKTDRKIFVDWRDGQFAAKGENAFFNAFELKDIDYVRNTNEIVFSKDVEIFPTEWTGHLDAVLYDFYEMIIPSKNIFQKIPKRYIPKGNLRKIYGYWRSKSQWENLQQGNNSLLPFVFRKDNIPMGDDYSYALEQDIVIYIDYCPSLRANQLKRHLLINPKITDEVSRFIETSHESGRLVGVHVRNTDKKPSQSIEALVDYLSSDVYKNQTILLCSDNPETEKIFQSRLSNVITFEKKSGRDSVLPPHRISYSDDSVDKNQILEDSLIDMFLLSACDELLYQGNSSFSNISRALCVNDKQIADDWLSIVAVKKK